MSSSNSYYSKNDTHNRNVINELREISKKEMDNIYKKYRFDYGILWLLVEVDFNPKMHCKIEASRMQYNYQYHGE